MLKHLIIIICSACISLHSFADNKIQKRAKDSPAVLTGFADIVEPLMSAVVNIYTVKYGKQMSSNSSAMPELFPFEQFNDFFRQYNIPFSFDDLYSNQKAMSLGSGFIIDQNGMIVTNNHVIVGSDEIRVKLADNTEFPAKIIGSDPKTDLALLKIDSKKKLPFVTFGNSNSMRVGDIVIAIGNPLGFGGTVTSGIVSSKGRDLGVSSDELVDDFIQTDTAINSGNSGGPLFNIEGKVIGVNTAIASAGGGTNIGIGFAIPSNTAQDIIKQLQEKGKITRGRLDIAIQEVTDELAEALNLDKKYGVLVVDVKTGGSGDKAGLKRGDVIIEFNGKQVTNSRKLQLFVAETHIGGKIKLVAIRQGKTIELNTDITEANIPAIEKDSKESTIIKSGITFSNLSERLLDKFQLDNESTGIIVTAIDISENRDVVLRIGDVIISVDQQHIKNINEFETIYNKIVKSGKKNIVLLVRRGEYKMFIALPVEMKR